MRAIVFALFLTICCIVGYINAASLPENPSENTDIALPEVYNEINEEEPDLNSGDEVDDSAEAAQSRTLFLLLPLLFPDQFYFS